MKNKLAFAKQIVLEAGEFLRTHRLDELNISQKTSQTDLVTQMDRQVQQSLIEKIQKCYPADHILAEEDGVRHDISDGNVWVIDPIDGTTNFIVQHSDFAVMVAYFEKGVGQFGLIYDVMADQLLYGGGEFPVYCNEQILPTFTSSELKMSLLSINAGMFEKNQWGLADLAAKSLGVRVYGSAAISFSRVLTGKLLAYFTCICPWDYAAASIMGEKLGYVTLTLNGDKPNFQSQQAIMMVPHCMQEEFLNYLKSHKEMTSEFATRLS
ncbi:inositol monophosphatase family protein [Streptococcus massiliensis]|uniref:Inositol monophosphatase n=1 Tax=Streptococcus massiliensis TaxID=313439 RepID=A0A380KW92_9STRE|nr:inositol monophosphatase family protein [Streptococcus massiliensis]SUN75955.1 inositol monophosphatase [Streptococcus massiliensis]